MITVNTSAYIRTHGHTPRQPRDGQMGAWAIQIDDDPTPRYLHMTLKDAIAQAKLWARTSITIVP